MNSKAKRQGISLVATAALTTFGAGIAGYAIAFVTLYVVPMSYVSATVWGGMVLIMASVTIVALGALRVERSIQHRRDHSAL